MDGKGAGLVVDDQGLCDMAAGLHIYIPNGFHLFDNEHMATQRAVRSPVGHGPYFDSTFWVLSYSS